MPTAASRRSRRLAWTLAILGLGLVALIAAFDWTWFRPLIQQHVQRLSGRHMDFDRLQIGLDGHLSPTVHFHNLFVQNASWAAPQPLIRAAELSATFEWASLFHSKRIVVTRIKLVDAEIDLEQQADGLRNWRITRPDDRGPGRIRVLTLDAERSRARYLNRGMDLDLQLQIDPLAVPQTLPEHDLPPLTKTLAVRGSRHATPFDGSFAVSDAISFFDSNRAFGLRGDIGTKALRMKLQGSAHDLLQFGGVDVDLHASGAGLADIGGLLGRPMPPWPALSVDVDAHLRKEGRDWSASRVVAHFGRSDVAGSLDYLAGDKDASHDAADSVSRVRATLASQRIDVAEWRAPRGTAGSMATDAPHGAMPSQLPSDPSPLDAQVDWQVATLAGVPLAMSGLRAHAAWRDDRLTLAPLDVVVAGGAVSGRLSYARASSSINLKLTGLQLDQLHLRGLSGLLDARVALQSRGDSIDSILAALDGSAEGALHHATLPDSLDAKMGLDGGRWLRTVIAGNHGRSAVLCSTFLMGFKKGIGTVRRLSLETDDVLLTGAGSIDLPQRRVDASITPQRKHLALFALDDSIRLDGALLAPSIHLARRSDETPPSAGCLASTTVQ